MGNIMEDPGEREAAEGVTDLDARKSHCSSNFSISLSSGPANVYDSKDKNKNMGSKTEIEE